MCNHAKYGLQNISPYRRSGHDITRKRNQNEQFTPVGAKVLQPGKNNFSLLTITLRVKRATSDKHFALAEFLPIPRAKNYVSLLKTGSLDNAIREFSLAKPSWYMSHYTMIYKNGERMRDFLGLFVFIVV